MHLSLVCNGLVLRWDGSPICSTLGVLVIGLASPCALTPASNVSSDTVTVAPASYLRVRRLGCYRAVEDLRSSTKHLGPWVNNVSPTQHGCVG